MGRFTIIGLGGKSKIDLVPDTAESENGNAYNSQLMHTDYKADLGVLGVTNLYFFNEKTRLETNLSLQGTTNKTLVDSMRRDLTVKRQYYRSELIDIKTSFSTELKSKINSKNVVNGGLVADFYSVNYIDSVYDDEDYYRFITLTNVKNKQLQLLRGYAQWQHKFTDQLVFNGGFHVLYFGLNEEISLEPRISAQWKFTQKQSFSIGFGKHSQIQSRMVYFTQTYDSISNAYWETNNDVKLSKSDHYVFGYNYLINSNLRLKIETYYQHLYNIPVSNGLKQFSMLNAGDNFGVPVVDSLVNDGVGKNYGVELTFEKFLSKGYYFLFTGSLFDSQYKAADGKWRNTAFNGNYVFNALGGYEIKIKGKNYLTFDIRTVWAGGRRYIPFNQEVYDIIEAVKSDPDTPVPHFDDLYDEERSFSVRYKDYFRTDFRIGFKINHKKYSEEFGIDLQNITNSKSLFSQEFNSENGKLIDTYQQGFSPMFLYRIQF
ncbi:MAG: hypothetical protein HC906_18400 [Bacteroidales bacterium]|nr:hypothetical protein [Bacteroidales bacterium]